MKSLAVTVLGAGNMGTALAKIIAENGYEVKIWNYEGDIEPLQQIEKKRENTKYLPDVKLSERVRPTYDLEHALESADIIFYAVNSASMEGVVKNSFPFVKNKTVLVDVSKGLNPKNDEFIPSLMKRLLKKKNNPIVSLTGPAVASQLARREVAVLIAATQSDNAALTVKKVLKNDTIQIFSSKDIVGAEVLQTFKNVYALGLGISSGIPMALNAQAVLLSVSLQELSILNKALGGKVESAYGIMGLGDLITTSFSTEGRNRKFGEWIGRGFSITEAHEKVGQTVEGIYALESLKRIMKRKKIALPLAKTIINIVDGKKKPDVAMQDFFQKM